MRMSKLRYFFDFVSSSCKPCKDSSDICTWLHRDDSKLILFIDPNKESLVVVMEDASSRWPISVESTSLEESISFLEQEMILYQLFLIFRSHCGERIVLSCEFTLELVASFYNFLFDLFSLSFCDTWSKWEICEISSDSNPCTTNHLCIFRGKRWAF